MPRWLVALLTAGVTAVVVVGGLAVVRTVVGSTRLLESSSDLGCMRDASASGYQGWCVERVSRPELLVVPGRHEIRVVAQVDGASGDRFLRHRDPFPDDDRLATRLTDGGLTLVDPAGTALTISRDRLDSLAD